MAWPREARRAFADDYLLQQDPPRGLLTLTPQDVRHYLATAAPNPISLRRFVRFLDLTGRLPATSATALTTVLKPT